MKKVLLLAVISLSILSARASENAIDSLQYKITPTTPDVTKAAIFNQMATAYMNYPSIQDRSVKAEYQEKALKYTFNAIHAYSRLDDSSSLRTSFDRLAKIYRDQRKYSQAKWYILQANTIARAQNDLPYITESLITLAGIKMDNKNYDWAEGDLGEALAIASINRFSEQQADVMLSYTRLWRNLHRPLKASQAEARYAFMKDSMTKDSAAKVMAKVVTKKKSLPVTARLVKNTIPKTAVAYTSL
ncbi:hypothetical protein [Mucilaginibacter ginkgonis]|uniref:Tetratricopeptide repeat protein n=1 Tax=Mucilaginibacter ginkgonis TaxID=2682091 RepID=A0A6I4HWU5_9SPHI|nr:hypothetical protein [Mucilaginibacter ginkgonis]QQL51312.1 hypothetical protein GO620_007665 [Mucilaginibacter ginkgonis]